MTTLSHILSTSSLTVQCPRPEAGENGMQVFE